MNSVSLIVLALALFSLAYADVYNVSISGGVFGDGATVSGAFQFDSSTSLIVNNSISIITTPLNSFSGDNYTQTASATPCRPYNSANATSAFIGSNSGYLLCYYGTITPANSTVFLTECADTLCASYRSLTTNASFSYTDISATSTTAALTTAASSANSTTGDLTTGASSANSTTGDLTTGASSANSTTGDLTTGASSANSTTAGLTTAGANSTTAGLTTAGAASTTAASTTAASTTAASTTAASTTAASTTAASTAALTTAASTAALTTASTTAGLTTGNATTGTSTTGNATTGTLSTTGSPSPTPVCQNAASFGNERSFQLTINASSNYNFPIVCRNIAQTLQYVSFRKFDLPADVKSGQVNISVVNNNINTVIGILSSCNSASSAVVFCRALTSNFTDSFSIGASGGTYYLVYGQVSGSANSSYSTTGSFSYENAAFAQVPGSLWVVMALLSILLIKY